MQLSEFEGTFCIFAKDNEKIQGEITKIILTDDELVISIEQHEVHVPIVILSQSQSGKFAILELNEEEVLRLNTPNSIDLNQAEWAQLFAPTEKMELAPA